jgi:hypothetical protein
VRHLTICLDFDGVLHDAAHPLPHRRMGPPLPGALAAIEELQRQGHSLTVHTARVRTEEQLRHVEDWLAYFGFRNVPVFLLKPMADVYLDDKAMRHVEWEQSLLVLTGMAGRPDAAHRVGAVAARAHRHGGEAQC